MRQFILLAGLCLLLGLNVACTKTASPCGDKKAKGLVLSHARFEAETQMTAFMAGVGMAIQTEIGKILVRSIDREEWKKARQHDYDWLELSLDNVTTKDVKEKVGSYQCAADLVISVKRKGEASRFPITFSLESSADKKDGFNVAVQGL